MKSIRALGSLLRISAVLLLTAVPIFTQAQDAPKSKMSKENAPTVVNKSDSNAVRLSVLNAVANYVNRAWEATFKIQWDFLPETPTLEGLSASVTPVEIVISNADLSNGSWSDRIGDPKKAAALADVLGMIALPGLTEKSDGRRALKEFLRTDQPLPDDYETRIQKNALSGPEKVAASTDHYALRAMLRSAGVRFKVKFAEDVVVQGGNERTFDSEVQWKITLYPVDKGTGDQKVTFYRAKMKAELRRPQTFTFPMSSSGKKSVKVIAALKYSTNTLALPTIVTAGDGSVNFPDKPAADVVTLPTSNSSTTIEGVLDFVGGVKLDDVVSKALFNPKNPGRLFYGGLIGQGRIKQLVGVNQLFSSVSRAAAFGLLLGIAPDRENALFIGPSLQTDALTLSVGAMALDRAVSGSADGKRSIKIEPAVTLSLDLSSLIGGSKNVQTIPLTDNVIGGISGDDVARDNYAVTSRIRPIDGMSIADKELILDKALLLRRTFSYGEKGRLVSIPPDLQSVFYLIVSETPLHRILPRGRYEVENGELPAGFAAFAPVETVPVKTIDIGQLFSEESLTIRMTIKRYTAPVPPPH